MKTGTQSPIKKLHSHASRGEQVLMECSSALCGRSLAVYLAKSVWKMSDCMFTATNGPVHALKVLH